MPATFMIGRWQLASSGLPSYLLCCALGNCMELMVPCVSSIEYSYYLL